MKKRILHSLLLSTLILSFNATTVGAKETTAHQPTIKSPEIAGVFTFKAIDSKENINPQNQTAISSPLLLETIPVIPQNSLVVSALENELISQNNNEIKAPNKTKEIVAKSDTIDENVETTDTNNVGWATIYYLNENGAVLHFETLSGEDGAKLEVPSLTFENYTFIEAVTYDNDDNEYAVDRLEDLDLCFSQNRNQSILVFYQQVEETSTEENETPPENLETLVTLLIYNEKGEIIREESEPGFQGEEFVIEIEQIPNYTAILKLNGVIVPFTDNQYIGTYGLTDQTFTITYQKENQSQPITPTAPTSPTTNKTSAPTALPISTINNTQKATYYNNTPLDKQTILPQTGEKKPTFLYSISGGILLVSVIIWQNKRKKNK